MSQRTDPLLCPSKMNTSVVFSVRFWEWLGNSAVGYVFENQYSIHKKIPGYNLEITISHSHHSPI